MTNYSSPCKDFQRNIRNVDAALEIFLCVKNLPVETADLHTADDIREVLKIVTDGKSRTDVNTLLNKLKRDEPYKNFPQVIAEFRKDDVYD